VSVSLRKEASVLNPSNVLALVPGLSKARKGQIKMICGWVKFIAFKTSIVTGFSFYVIITGFVSFIFFMAPRC